jgi:hypothetical protein
MGWKEDDEKAYTTSDDIVGRSFRRGIRKGLAAVTFGLIKGTDPMSELAGDAAKELATKVIPRSGKNR